MAAALKHRTSLPADAEADAFFSELGRELLAPLLHGFCQWIQQRLREDRPDCLLFFGRDGRIAMDAFLTLYPGTVESLPIHYCRASRRALEVARLRQRDPKFLDFLTRHAGGMTLEQLFGRLSLPEAALSDCLDQQPGITGKSLFTDDRKQVVAAVLEDLWTPLLNQAANERQAYLAYLKSLGVLGKSHIAVVDIGWHGSLQRALTRILNTREEGVRTSGYYLGLFPGALEGKSRDVSLSGWLFEGREPTGRFEAIHSFVELVEFLFSSTEQGLVRFRAVDANPEPVGTGEVLSPYQAAAIGYLQRAALAELPRLDGDSRDPWSLLKQLGCQPGQREARFLGPITAAQSFGHPHRERALAEPGPAWLNLLGWAGFCRRFKECLWRRGFWTRLTPLERGLLKRLSPEGTRPLLGS